MRQHVAQAPKNGSDGLADKIKESAGVAPMACQGYLAELTTRHFGHYQNRDTFPAKDRSDISVALLSALAGTRDDSVRVSLIAHLDYIGARDHGALHDVRRTLTNLRTRLDCGDQVHEVADGALKNLAKPEADRDLPGFG